MKKHFACVLVAAMVAVLAWGMLAGGLMTVTAGDSPPTPTLGAPLTASDYVGQGDTYLEQGDYEQAIAACSEAIRLDPGLAEAYLIRGMAYDEQEEHVLALADLTEYVRVAGDNADPAALDLIEHIEAAQGIMAVEGWVTVAIMVNLSVGGDEVEPTVDQTSVDQTPMLYYGDDTEVEPEKCSECYTLNISPDTEVVVPAEDIVSTQFILHSGPEHQYVMIGRPGLPAPTNNIWIAMASIPSLNVSYIREFGTPQGNGTHPAIYCTVMALGNANLRGGPGTDFDIVGGLASGETADIIAKAVEPSFTFWYRLLEGGWIRSDLVKAPDDCQDLPIEMVIEADARPAPTAGAPPATSDSETLETPLTASDYVAQGEVYFEQGEYEQAITVCSEAIRLDPGLAEAYINRGMAYYEQGDYVRAIADFDEAIRVEPDNAWAYNERGMAYTAQGNGTRAIADFDQAQRLAPDDAIVYNNRGAVYLTQGEYMRAIADFDEAIRLAPGYTNAYRNRGRAYLEQGKYERAIPDFDETIRLDPGDADAYNNRGFAYLQLREYEQAFADFDEAIRLNPNHAAAYGNRGFIYFLQGEYAQAIADFDQSIILDPGIARTYLNRGSAYFSQGEYAQAITDFDEAIRLDPGYVIAYRNRGRVYVEQGEYARAITDFGEAVRLDPGNPTAYFLRGRTYYLMGEYDAALADLTEHVRLAGDRADPSVFDLIEEIEAMQEQ